MVDYREFSSWACYGCKFADVENQFIPIYYCRRRHQYLKVKLNKCKHFEDDDPSNWF